MECPWLELMMLLAHTTRVLDPGLPAEFVMFMDFCSGCSRIEVEDMESDFTSLVKQI